ncbi:glycosyltransferase [Mycobacterium kubicae]|uniref:Glycosyltransferase n=1 Tax=Mycobacterium kubicae TaxID=120959 RepID=A0AAX1JB21_9MYCO|nr:glycosyltransferase [Mycobacterium kubicae]MCV7098291.1 glycosyltransferase [Mycobacterium kubicae]ORV98218.1 glycosyl transferase [Mycobacterium kubicae]QNI14218.1 glycosyltransferase [Mycobacterium kubicae]QPI37732.1 glycosyltransferase [Mycobacterium kubicae]
MLEPGAAQKAPRNVLVWHVHGSWTQAFVAGAHRYLIPVAADRGSGGIGLAGRSWPNAREVALEELRQCDIDLVVLQRPEEVELLAQWAGRRAGVDLPAVYVEHNAPRPHAERSRHPLADQSDIPLIHVTDFNRLMWDNGSAPTQVIDHGMADPGQLYTGDIPRVAAMINEPVRRARTVGTDLLQPLSAYGQIDVWGMGTEALSADNGAVIGRGDVAAPQLWTQVARRRVYLHTARWTSLGLSLVEAMFLGMPVVAVGTTMAPFVVPTEAGVVSADVCALGSGVREFLNDHAAAVAAGKAAREFATTRFGLKRFLTQWDEVIDQVIEEQRS